MTFQIAYVLVVAVAMLVVLVREWFPADGVAVGVVVALVLGGSIPPAEAAAGLGDSAILTVAAMFVLAAGLTRTGAVEFVGRRILRAAGKGEARLVAVLMLTVSFLSAFVNNTPLAVIFLPIVLGLSDTTGVPGSKLLIPMSYATIVGGMCSVIGTSTNVLVSDRLPRYGLAPVAMFEPLVLGAVGVLVTTAYMTLVGRRLLPARTTVSGTVRAGKIRDYVTEIAIPRGSPLAGRGVAEAILSRAPGLRVLQVVRGEEILPPDHGPAPLAEGDLLLVRGEASALLALERTGGVEVAPELRPSEIVARRRDATLAELIVRPGSAAIGQRVRDLGLHEVHGALVLAVQRHGTHLREKVADLVLRFGDVLLVQVDADAIERLHAVPGFVVVEGVGDGAGLSHRAPLAFATIVAVMGLAALQVPWLPVWLLALAGAALMTAGGCVGVREAYRSVDLRLLVLMWGTITLGEAMGRSGAAAWIAQGLVGASRTLGDVAILSAVYLMTNVLTALVSNAAAALVMLPIAVATAQQAGLETRPFVIAIMFAASIDFSTPIGYQTNTFVYGPGGYRFSDYVRVGTPLNLLWWVLATLLIPLLWPLRAG